MAVLHAGSSLWKRLKYSRCFGFYSVEEGLAGHGVFSICQDSMGFLWLGTQGGLVKYNGYERQRFDYRPPGADFVYSVNIETMKF